MSETFFEAPLFRAYEVVFQTLLSGLVIGVAVLFVAAIVLIILCCWQLKAQTRQRDAQARSAAEACLKGSRDGPDLGLSEAAAPIFRMRGMGGRMRQNPVRCWLGLSAVRKAFANARKESDAL